MRRTLALVLLGLAPALLTVACGDDDDVSDDSDDTSEVSDDTPETDEPDQSDDEAAIEEVVESAADDDVLVSLVTSGGIEGVRIVDVVVLGDGRAVAQDDREQPYVLTNLDPDDVVDLLTDLLDTDVRDLADQRIGNENVSDGFERAVVIASPDGPITFTVLEEAADRQVDAVLAVLAVVHDEVLADGREVDPASLPVSVTG